MNPFPVPYPGDRTLFHYTDKAGYDGIMTSKKIKVSSLEGKKHTHYGEGVYFTSVDSSELSLFPYDAISGIFNRVTEQTVAKMLYCVAVRIDPGWFPYAAFDHSEYDPNDVWVVPLEAGQVLELGQHLQKDFSGPTGLLEDTLTTNAKGCAKELLALEMARKTREARERGLRAEENLKRQQATGWGFRQ